MMYKSLFASALLVGAVTAADPSPNAQIVVNALAAIRDKTVAVDSMVKNFDILQALDLQVANLAVLATISEAVQNVTAIKPLEVADSIPLTQAVLLVKTTVNESISNVISKKVDFGGLQPIVLDTLQKQQAATIKLSTTILTKLPASIVPIAAQVNLPIFQSFIDGIQVFSTPNVNTDPSLYTDNAASVKSVSAWAAALVVCTALVLA